MFTDDNAPPIRDGESFSDFEDRRIGYHSCDHEDGTKHVDVEKLTSDERSKYYKSFD
jgi:hypothetical protein